MKIAAIILAAGRSSRFGQGNKLLADLDGQPVIRHVVSAVEESPIDDVVLVTAPEADAIARAAGRGRWRSVTNPAAESGLSSSIRAGIESLEATTDGALIVLADMPGINSALLEQLCEAFSESGGRKIVFPQTADGQQRNPVLWPRSFFAELSTLIGDVGGKALLAHHRDSQNPVSIATDKAFFDVDTAADLAYAHAEQDQPQRRK